MFLSSYCSLRCCKKTFVPMFDKLFWFSNKDLILKVLFSFSSFNNFIGSREEKTKSDSCFPVLLNSIWFFKSYIFSIKDDFKAAISTSRDELRLGSILLSSVCVETLHTSGVCCVIGIGSVSVSANVPFTNDVTTTESNPAAVLLLTSFFFVC